VERPAAKLAFRFSTAQRVLRPTGERTGPILQSGLISRHKFQPHRRLGWVTLLILAPLLVISGLHMVQLMIVRYEQTHAIRLLKFAFLDRAAFANFAEWFVRI